MTAVAQKTVLTGCLAPIDRQGLEKLIENGKANPKVIKTLKCKTVAEGKFRHANYIRNLAPYIVDEPPGLLGDDTAPNPSEASLAALGSCLAVGLHANAVHRGWIVNKLELAARGRPQHHRGLGHRRRQREAGRLHRRAGQGRHGMRGRSAGRDRRAGGPRQEVVAGRQHLYPPGQSRGQRMTRPRRACPLPEPLRPENPMNPVAASRLTLDEDRELSPSVSVVDAVAAIARNELAPLAAAIDSGSVYPAELLRRLGDAGAWGSHRPAQWQGRSRLRHPVDRGARRGLRRHRLHGVVPEHAGLVRGQSRNPALRRIRRRRRVGQDSRRHRPFQSDEELLRHRETEAEGPAGRRRLRRARRAALGLQPRPRPFLRHDLRGRGQRRRAS